jgi:hypothetical protein
MLHAYVQRFDVTSTAQKFLDFFFFCHLNAALVGGNAVNAGRCSDGSGTRFALMAWLRLIREDSRHPVLAGRRAGTRWMDPRICTARTSRVVMCS